MTSYRSALVCRGSADSLRTVRMISRAPSPEAARSMRDSRHSQTTRSIWLVLRAAVRAGRPQRHQLHLGAAVSVLLTHDKAPHRSLPRCRPGGRPGASSTSPQLRRPALNRVEQQTASGPVTADGSRQRRPERHRRVTGWADRSPASTRPRRTAGRGRSPAPRREPCHSRQADHACGLDHARPPVRTRLNQARS
jgi:hypothetical protein